MAEGTFQLIDFKSNYTFEFQYFPSQIRLNSRSNWDPQNTTIGTRPLFYANGDPMQISVEDLQIDESDTGTSVKPTIDLLLLLKTEEEDGPPPALLAQFGDWTFRCVLESVNVKMIHFNNEGECDRAEISIELLELQEDGESTSVSVYTEDIF
jgi:phage protein U